MKLNWLPIEDAPRDGTRVIVWPPTWPGKATTTAFWCDNLRRHHTKPHWQRLDDKYGRSCDEGMEPTHYMPLLRGPNGEEA